jgi:NADPH:quinone reductase-like Zn-dependent oxidoreductase
MNDYTLPHTHRVLKLTSRDQPLSVESVPTPKPGPGSAVLRVLVAGVLSYSGDVYSGKKPYPFPTPLVPGSGAIGRIVAVGPDATLLTSGTLVLFDSTIRSRDNPNDAFLSGLSSRFTEGGGAKLMGGEWRDSTYAEYAKVPLENCVPLDEARLLGPGAGSLGYTVSDL